MSWSASCLVGYACTRSAPLRKVLCVSVPQRRIDDRIRDLCVRLKAASHGDLDTILQELLRLVHQKNDRLKRRAARLLLKGDHMEPERRLDHGIADTKLQHPASDDLGHPGSDRRKVGKEMALSGVKKRTPAP